MRSLASIGVHDYLAPCQSRVPVRSSDDEFPCRVHVEYIVSLEKGGSLRGELLYHCRDQDFLDVFPYPVLHCLVYPVLSVLLYGIFIAHSAQFRHHEVVVLGGDDYSMDADRPVGGAIVFNGEL